MLLDAKVTVRQMSDEHVVLSNKVKRLRANFRKMLEAELARLDEDQFGVLDDLDRSDVSAIDRELGIDLDPAPVAAEAPVTEKSPTIIVSDKPSLDELVAEDAPETSYGLGRATISDLSEGLKKMAEEPASIGDTIILK